MKIALIGPCTGTSIPPSGWGACESIVWDYYVNLKNIFDVTILNDKNLNYIINEINKKKFDVVHIMYDDNINLVPYINCSKIFYTSHYAYITHKNFENEYTWYFNNIFKKVIQNKDKIIINVISNQIKNVYIKYGFPKNKINVLCNGAREDVFKYSENPKKSKRSIYMAKIEFRKRQYIYQNIDKIDFVGNFHNSSFDRNNKNYLGEWNKETLYNTLTEYGNLILLSDGEADPLVIKEALICGLGVVISECASANLDLNKPFINVIPDDKLNNIEYIKDIIEKNRIISISMREEIRKYAIENFTWKNIINKYIKLM